MRKKAHITAPFATPEDTAEILEVVMTTRMIRRAIYLRQGGRCRMCDKTLTYQGCHMHEIVPRGKGGKISLTNSEILCKVCHLDVVHGGRKPQFKGRKDA